MSVPEAIAEARRWFRFAAEDLHAAESMLANEEMVPRHACWLAQQAAEKALKAGLVVEQIPFPFRHDLDALRNLLPDRWATKQMHSDLAELTEWAVEARYPGDWSEATKNDARSAIVGLDAVLALLSGYLEATTIPKWVNGINGHRGNRRPIDVLREGRLSEVIAAIKAEKSGAFT